MAKMGLDKWIVILTVISAAMLQLIDMSIVNVSLIQMMGNLGATLGDISWVVTGYAAANVVMITLSGWLSAKMGRKNYFAASIILFTVASIFCGTSTNVWELVFYRVIQGIGGGGLLSTAQAILVETFPKEELGLANAIYGIGVIIGPTIGPTLGGFITDNLSWHWIFFINIPVGIAATIMTFLFVKEPAEKQRAGRMDWLGIALLVMGIGSLQVVLEKGQEEDWFSTPYILILSILGVVGFVGFIIKMLVTEDPIIDLRILKNRSFSVGTLFNFILGIGLFASVFIVPVFAQNFLGFTATDTGLLLMPGSIATAFMMPFVGNALKKRIVSPLILAGLGFIIFFFFCIMLSNLNSTVGPGDFFWPLIIRGVGLGFIFIPLTTLSLSELRGKDIPQGTALSNMARQLGGSFGTAVMTTFIASRVKFHYNQLSYHVVATDPGVLQRLNMFKGAFISKGMSAVEASQAALKAMYGMVMKQAALLTYMDSFKIVGWGFIVCIPLLLLFRTRKKKNATGEPEEEQHIEMVME